jgi:pimeloyl-ACP methyl ester carboxylesterase
MATYVLVHGGNISTDTWDRLAGREDYPPGGHLGSRCWDGTMAFLTAHHHRVFAPTLKDENCSTLSEHIGQVSGLVTGNDLREVILVGHSYGGMVITGVAGRMCDRIRRLVYLDAALPDPGQSLYDILKIGLASISDPSPLLPEPVPPYVERLEFDAVTLQALPKTYILCTKSEFINVTRVAQRKIFAAREGWTYLELPSSHVPMADMPDRFYQLMLDAVL